jgi:hypothetical protein
MALPITIATSQGVGNSAGVECRGALVLAVYGTHGGSTQPQLSPDDGTTWINFGAAITADTVVEINVPVGSQLRLAVTTAGTINAKAGQVQQVG